MGEFDDAYAIPSYPQFKTRGRVPSALTSLQSSEAESPPSAIQELRVSRDQLLFGRTKNRDRASFRHLQGLVLGSVQITSLTSFTSPNTKRIVHAALSPNPNARTASGQMSRITRVGAGLELASDA